LFAYTLKIQLCQVYISILSSSYVASRLCERSLHTGSTVYCTCT